MEAGGVGGVTNILVAHYQQQHKHRLAVSQLLKRLFICVCVVTLCVWIKGREASEDIAKEGGFAFGEKGNYMTQKIKNINGITGQRGSVTYQTCSGITVDLNLSYNKCCTVHFLPGSNDLIKQSH